MTHAYGQEPKLDGSASPPVNSNYTKTSIGRQALMSEIFALRLQAARQMRGLSQSELAARAALQPSAISHFENGRRSPSFDNLKLLSNALDVTTDYLLGRVESPQLTGVVRDQLFRHAENMSKNDLDTLTSFAEMLAKKAGQNRKE